MERVRITLERENGEAAGTRYCVTAARAEIGRHPDCAISLPDELSISRRHSELRLDETSARVVDLASQNGTFLDGEKVEEAVLRDGQLLQVGKVRFRVHLGAPALPARGGASAPAAPGQGGAPGSELGPRRGQAVLPEVREADLPARRTLWKALLLVVLAGLGLYLAAWFLDRPGRARETHYILRRREKLVLYVPSVREGRAESIVKVVGDDAQPIVSWRPYKGLLREDLAEGFLVFEGRAQGDATVVIDPPGSGSRTLRLHVRGILPRDWDEETITRDEALRLARRKEEEARRLAPDQPYHALVRYGEAAELFLRAGLGAEAERVESDRRLIAHDLGQAVTRAYEEARTLMRGTPTQPVDYAGAIERLSEIKQLVPDPQSVDWQLADRVEELARNRLR